MSVTLTFGLKRPADGDTGDSLFTDLEDNINQLDAHNHDGVTSAKLTASSVTAVTQAVASGSWVATSNGNYSQTVTLPAGLTYANILITMRDSSSHTVFPTIEFVSTTTYKVFTNDNTQAWTAVYVS